MAQIFSLLLMAFSLAGLGILLTRKTKRERWITIAGLLGILATLLVVASLFGIAPDRMFSFLASFLIIAGIYSVLTLGLNIQWGYTGLFNIGVAGFFGVGAYVSTILVQSPDTLPSGGGLESFVATYFGLPFPVGLGGFGDHCLVCRVGHLKAAHRLFGNRHDWDFRNPASDCLQ